MEWIPLYSKVIEPIVEAVIGGVFKKDSKQKGSANSMKKSHSSSQIIVHGDQNNYAEETTTAEKESSTFINLDESLKSPQEGWVRSSLVKDNEVNSEKIINKLENRLSSLSEKNSKLSEELSSLSPTADLSQMHKSFNMVFDMNFGEINSQDFQLRLHNIYMLIGPRLLAQGVELNEISLFKNLMIDVRNEYEELNCLYYSDTTSDMRISSNTVNAVKAKLFSLGLITL
jgi:hypothetical protein